VTIFVINSQVRKAQLSTRSCLRYLLIRADVFIAYKYLLSTAVKITHNICNKLHRSEIQ